jgi:hypothetical protein
MQPSDEELLKDLDRLAVRVNSEEGIPMFLACEDLGADRQEETDTQFNHEFVSTLLRDAGWVQTARPDAPLTVLAKIVERLSEVDFALSKQQPGQKDRA